MSILNQLIARSSNACELFTATTTLRIYEIPPNLEKLEKTSLYICEKCNNQLDKKEELDEVHWACLNTNMWSEVPAVQIVSWRMLNRLRYQTWAAEAIDMMYLDDESLALAKTSGDHENDASVDLHRDCNGAILKTGDNVVLIKSLDVKGSSVNAKLGTVVHNIKIVAGKTDQIEGRIEGQLIVILTKYVRKNG
jgi:protein PhnA